MSEFSKSQKEMYGMENEGGSGNILLGIIGAIVGALLGAVLWVVFNQFGIIAAIAGIAIAWCANKGFAMLSKKENMKAVIISTIIALLVVTLAHYLCWGLDIFNAFSIEYEITFMDALKAVPEFAFDPEYPDSMIGFIRDLAIGYVTVCVGTAPFFRKAKAIA